MIVHVSQLGMDCRYCHSFVDVAAHSNLPNTQTCMACHTQVQKDNPKLEPVRASWKTGQPIEWVQLHRSPDYVYYNHAAHVNRGISCASCHGRGQSDAGRLSCQTPQHGVVPRVPSASGKFPPARDR